MALAKRSGLVYPAPGFHPTDEQARHPVNPHNPGLLQVAAQAQDMAAHAKQQRMAVAFQTVAMVSMAVMGLTAAGHLIRDLLRAERGRGRG
jgi:hypothetical protein